MKESFMELFMKTKYTQRLIEIFVASLLGLLIYISTKDSFGIESLIISFAIIGASYLLTRHYFQEFDSVKPIQQTKSADLIQSYSIIFLDKNGNIQTWDKGAQNIW